MKNTLIVLLTFIVVSCNNSSTEKRECNCNLGNLLTVKMDSLSTRNEKTPIDINLEAKLATKIKKVIDVETGGNINVALKELKLGKIVEVVSNDMPEHNDVMLYYRMKKLIYCEYYERLCQDTLITYTELNQIANKKLEEIDTAVENYFSFEGTKQLEKKKKDSNTIEKKRFSLYPENEFLINYIEKETGLKYSRNTFDYKIEISKSGETILTNENKSLYKYSGGNIKLILNENDCYTFEDLVIPESMNLGNPLQPLNNSLDNKIKNLIKSNRDKIGIEIINCLK